MKGYFYFIYLRKAQKYLVLKDWKELLNLENDEVMDDGMVNLRGKNFVLQYNKCTGV